MPLFIIFFIYIVLAIFYWVANIFIIYHLYRYGVNKDSSRIMAVIFFIVSIILFSTSVIIVSQVDWATKL